MTARFPALDLWARADLSAGPEACWPWIGNRNDAGYGRLSVNGVRWYAHRLAYVLARGPIPTDMQVCHRCDNPACVNPAHLFLGTNADNQRDKIAKGRQWMRLPRRMGPVLLDLGIPAKAMARDLGVSPRTVYRRLAEARVGTVAS